MVIDGFYDYVCGKFTRFSYVPSKFVYRENMLGDLGDLSELFLLFIDELVRKGKTCKATFACLSKVIEMLVKVSKSMMINFNRFSDHFIDNKDCHMLMVV